MTTFIIICLIAIAIEASRRYFIVNKYCEAADSNWKTIVSSFSLIAATVSAYYIRDWTVAIALEIGAIFVCLSSELAYAISLPYDPSSDEPLTAHEKKQIAAYFCSWLIPLIVIIPVTAVTVNQDNKEFEVKWQQTEALTINCQPLKTIVNGNETVVLECTEISNDISLGVDKYGFDVLKLEKMDKVKYLKLGRRERFKILTLKGQNYTE